MTRITIGPPTGEHVALALPDAITNPEGWYRAEAHIRVNGFVGDITFHLQLSDVARFADQLSTLYDSLSGTATLDTDERQFRLELVGNGRGQITVSGVAFAWATSGSRLEFTFGTDQTFLSAPLRASRDFVAIHHTRGP